MKKLIPVAVAILSVFDVRQLLAAWIVFTAVFVVWMIFIVICWAIGAGAEAVPSLLRTVFFIKFEEASRD